MQKTNIILLLLLFYSATILVAQDEETDRSNYALLWEISGKDLSEPSYIFGTFHIRDKAAFHFPDSFFITLLACDAFANEIHLDSAMMQELAFSMQDSLVEEQIFKYKEEPRGSKIRKRPLNPKGEGMPTFLDAYLMNIAKLEGKTLYGLEDMDKHLALVRDNQKKLEDRIKETPQVRDDFDKKAWYQEILEAYLTGDMQKMEEKFLTEAFNKEVNLIKRNYEMVESIARIATSQSLFSCVGAAHLPGEEGVLRLLEERGYRLRPVTASFTGLADAFVPKKDTTNWVITTNTSNSFQFQTPSSPIKIQEDADIFDLYLSLDIGNGLFYYAYVFDQSLIREEETYYDTIKHSFLEEQQMSVYEEKVIEKQGIKGREYWLTQKGGNFPHGRGQCFIKKGKLYLLMLGAFEKHQLESVFVEKYFASLTFSEQAENWAVKKEETGAFSVYMPSQLRTIKNEVPNPHDSHANPYIINAYLGTDSELKKTYIMRYNDFPSGSKLENDTVFFQGAIGTLVSNLNGEIVDQKNIEIQTYPGRSYQLENDEVAMEVAMYLRGNRAYVLMEIGEKNAPKGDFIPSFELEPFLPMEAFTKQRLFDGALIASLPEDVYTSVSTEQIYNQPEVEAEYIYYSSEKNTGVVFRVECVPFSPYLEVTDLDSFLVESVKDVLKGDDVLFEREDRVVMDTYPAKFFQIHNFHNNLETRHLLFFRYNVMYLLSAYFPYELEGTEPIEQFFESIEFTGKDVYKSDLLVPKTATLFQDLQSTDRLTLQKAKDAFRFFEFKKSDLPSIYQALEKKYNDDTLQSSSVKMLLLEELIVLHDDETFPVLKKIYHQNEAIDIKNKVLLVLSEMGSDLAFQTMFELTTTQTVELPNIYRLLRPFKDSLHLFERYYPELTQWAVQGIDAYQYFLLSEQVMLTDNIDKGFIINNLKAYEDVVQSFISDSKKRENNKINDAASSYIIKFYSTIPVTKTRIEQVKQLYEAGQIWTKLAALEYLFKKGKRVEKTWVKSLLEDSIYYYPTLELLQEYQHLNLATKAQRQEERIAAGMLRKKIFDYEGYVPVLELIKTREIMYKGHKAKVYVFYHNNPDKVKGETLPNQYIGIAGAFLLNKKDSFFNSEFCDFSHQEVSGTTVVKEIERLLAKARN